MYLTLGDDVTKKFNLGKAILALLFVDGESIFGEYVENGLGALFEFGR